MKINMPSTRMTRSGKTAMADSVAPNGGPPAKTKKPAAKKNVATPAAVTAPGDDDVHDLAGALVNLKIKTKEDTPFGPMITDKVNGKTKLLKATGADKEKHFFADLHETAPPGGTTSDVSSFGPVNMVKPPAKKPAEKNLEKTAPAPADKPVVPGSTVAFTVAKASKPTGAPIIADEVPKISQPAPVAAVAATAGAAPCSAPAPTRRTARIITKPDFYSDTSTLNAKSGAKSGPIPRKANKKKDVV